MSTQTDIPAFLALGFGALLLWAAVKNESPYKLLRDTLSGQATKPSKPRSVSMPTTGTKPMPPSAGGTVAA